MKDRQRSASSARRTGPFAEEARGRRSISLGGDEPKALRVDVERTNGLYARLEGRNILASYIGYRKSLNIEAKHIPGRSIRLFEAELGYKGAMLDALCEIREIADRLIALLEGREDAKQDQ